MVWPIRQKASCIFAPTMAAVSTLRLGLSNTHLGVHRHTSGPNQRSLAQAEETHIGFLHDIKRHPVVGVEALSDVSKAKNGLNFGELKDRFLSFKKQKFLKESEHFQNLAQVQDPKFMVIACADSRVCPSNILGFQPGEALMIRNVANLVPPFENGASETNAALEFAVNTLEVENIFVIGHSSCAGIETLMTMQDDGDSSFTHRWVVNAKVAKLRTKAATLHLSFDQQCRYCEKESINHSLLNLLAYPWIADKVRKKLLSIHGGYYDFLNCAFDKWTLDVNDSNSSLGEKHYSVKDRELWL
ncbi:beta carbonic anhydrase 5, chloroplastic-like isoform X2 [Argentina anserina]|uniref:beta carbonic anhydrase 5, chloroplastic-like isoform X2 n=1 Tax=Argentina anserina TaxID=57926 RepID=UPI002176542F|nr:beta carbonic anhydrase 5, chloroplastic-like isoform X2 [Potentilla anserina]